MSINTRISELISALGMSKAEFSRTVDISQAVISKITIKRVNFGVDIYANIIKSTNVNPDWLFFGAGVMFKEADTPGVQIHPSKNTFTGHNLIEALATLKITEEIIYSSLNFFSGITENEAKSIVENYAIAEVFEKQREVFIAVNGDCKYQLNYVGHE